MSATVNMDLLNALAAQLGREKVVAMCEAFLKPSAFGKVKKPKEAAAEGVEKPKRVLPFKLVQWQAFVRYAKERFPERFEGVKGAPAMQAVCKSLKEEEGIWEAFEASPSCPQPALEPAHNTSGWARAAEDEDTEDEAAPAPVPIAGGEEAKPKRKWSEEAKASAKAKRAAKKAAGASSSDSESVASAGSAKVKAE
jgi:hypothetical protein